MRYLSDEWLHEADQLLRSMAAVPDALVVGYLVTDGPDGDRSYSLTLGPDAVGVQPGTDTADVTLRLDWSLAAEIACGTASAQRSFLDGKLVLGGDSARLLGHPKALTAVDDHLAPLRHRTIFE
jgi:hypothetical protein